MKNYAEDKYTYIRGQAPWADTRRVDTSKQRESTSHYRGWTLVDAGRSMVAVRDEGGIRLRVAAVSHAFCKNGVGAPTLAAFRKKVDAWEAAHEREP